MLGGDGREEVGWKVDLMGGEGEREKFTNPIHIPCQKRI